MKKVLYIGILMALTLFVAACSTTQNNAPTGNTVAENDVTGKVVDMSIDMFNYGFDKPTLTINKGDRVRLKVTNRNGRHSLAIPEFGVGTSVLNHGGEQVIEFVADKLGSFDFFCSTPCGSGHHGMRGKINVQ